MRSMSWKWGVLLGFWIGVSFMAIADVGDVHFCVGQCDGKGLTLWGTSR
jgi:hypothetical protein